MSGASALFGRFLTGIIGAYRLLISPILPPSCRYYPTCSEYAINAVRLHGPGWGAWLGLKRVLRCHPWAAGGVDPVPSEAPSEARASHRRPYR